MKKLNWGHGIFIAIAIFMSGLFTLVMMTVHQKIELVTEDYYPKELKYEDQIQKQKNTQSLNSPLNIEVGDSVKVQFPPDFIDFPALKGEVWFYRASDKSCDIFDSISLSNSLTLSYPISQFKNGKYDVIIDWKYLEKSFFYKQTIYIDKN